MALRRERRGRPCLTVCQQLSNKNKNEGFGFCTVVAAADPWKAAEPTPLPDCGGAFRSYTVRNGGADLEDGMWEPIEGRRSAILPLQHATITSFCGLTTWSYGEIPHFFKGGDQATGAGWERDRRDWPSLALPFPRCNGGYCKSFLQADVALSNLAQPTGAIVPVQPIPIHTKLKPTNCA
jgi:hypothetical protein